MDLSKSIIMTIEVLNLHLSYLGETTTLDAVETMLQNLGLPSVDEMDSGENRELLGTATTYQVSENNRMTNAKGEDLGVCLDTIEIKLYRYGEHDAYELRVLDIFGRLIY